MAAGELETSPLGLAAGRSFLGGVLVEAIEGQADLQTNGGDGDSMVSLAEMERYIQTASRQNGVATPKPQWIACGAQLDPKKRKKSLNDHILVELNKDSKKEDGEPSPQKGDDVGGEGDESLSQNGDDKKPAESPPNATKESAPDVPVSGDSKTDSTADTPENEKIVEPDSEPDIDKKPASSPDDPDNLRLPIMQAWQRRDDLERRFQIGTSIRKANNPIDYAPQLWTQWNAELFAHHLQQLDHLETDTNPIMTRLNDLVRKLDGHDDDDWSSFESVNLNAMSEDYNEKYFQYKNALLDFRYYLYRAAQYVRWHRMALGVVSKETTRDIEQLLNSLKTFDDKYRDFTTKHKEKPLDSWGDAEVLSQQITAVQKDVDKLDTRVKNGIESMNDRSQQRIMEIYLATDLVTVNQREKLLALLKQGVTSDQIDSRSDSKSNWEAAFRHAGLECQLAKIVNPDWELDFDPFADGSIDKVMKQFDGDEQKPREWFRALGKKLYRFYDTEAKSIDTAEPQNGNRDEDSYKSEKMTVLLHPRDVHSSSNAGHIVENRIGLPGEITLTPKENETALSQTALEEIAWELSIVNTPGSSAKMQLDFDKDVDVLFNSKPIESGKILPLPKPIPPTLQFQVKARRKAYGSRQDRTKTITLKVFLKKKPNGESKLSRTAYVVLPDLNPISLTAWCLEPLIEETSKGSNNEEKGVQLQPFPDHGTQFKLELEIQSDSQREKLDVELIAVPLLENANWPPGRLFDTRGRLYEPLRTWLRKGEKLRKSENNSTVVPFVKGELKKLLAGLSRRTIKFAHPGSENPEAKPAQEGAANDEEAPQQKQPSAVDITHGILCRLASNSGEVWHKWIEIVPRRPHRYLNAEAEIVTVENGRKFQLSIWPKDLYGGGQGGQSHAVFKQTVALVLRPVNIPGMMERMDAEINDKNNKDNPVKMFITLPNNLPDRASLELSIDNYQRAFVWQLNKGLDNGPVVANEDRRSVSIDWISMGGDKNHNERVYRLKNDAVIPESDDKEIFVPHEMGQQPICPFNVHKGSRPLQMGLRVDTPLDAFQKRAKDVVKVSWQDSDVKKQKNFDLISRHLYFDRDISSVVELTETGMLKITSTASDYTLPIPYPNVDHGLTLNAELWLAEDFHSAEDFKSKLKAETAVTIILDSSPPKKMKWDDWEIPDPVTVGKPFNIQLTVEEDRSGISLLEVWISAETIDPDKLDSYVVTSSEGPFRPSSNSHWAMDLEFKPLKEAVAYYTYYRVTDGSGQSSEGDGPPFKAELPEKPRPKGPVIADLHVKVIYPKGRLATDFGINLHQLKGKLIKKAYTNSGGIFEVKNLKAGSYQLSWNERIKINSYIGKLDIELVEEADFEGIEVQLEKKEKKEKE
jgi:hypothetical protein